MEWVWELLLLLLCSVLVFGLSCFLLFLELLILGLQDRDGKEEVDCDLLFLLAENPLKDVSETSDDLAMETSE